MLAYSRYASAPAFAELLRIRHPDQALRGQTLGVVGRTGSGKSTLLKQLLHEYPAGSGTLSISGHPIQGVMAPLASGKMSLQTIGESFLHWKSLLAIGVGLLVAYLGGRGATLMGTQPTVVAGLLIGTVLGVALFKGVILCKIPDDARLISGFLPLFHTTGVLGFATIGRFTLTIEL